MYTQGNYIGGYTMGTNVVNFNPYNALATASYFNRASFETVASSPFGIMTSFGNRFQARVPDFHSSALLGGIPTPLFDFNSFGIPFGGAGFAGNYGGGYGGFDPMALWNQMTAFFSGATRTTTTTQSGGHTEKFDDPNQQIAADFCNACDETQEGYTKNKAFDDIIQNKINKNNVAEVIKAWDDIHVNDTEPDGKTKVADFATYFLTNASPDQINGRTGNALIAALEARIAEPKEGDDTTKLQTIVNAIKAKQTPTA
jgi:hypothetical protein